jgi:hypothetical protein
MKGRFLMVIDAVAACEATECDDGFELGPPTLLCNQHSTRSRFQQTTFIGFVFSRIDHLPRCRTRAISEDSCSASHCLIFSSRQCLETRAREDSYLCYLRPFLLEARHCIQHRFTLHECRAYIGLLHSVTSKIAMDRLPQELLLRLSGEMGGNPPCLVAGLAS